MQNIRNRRFAIQFFFLAGASFRTLRLFQFFLRFFGNMRMDIAAKVTSTAFRCILCFLLQSVLCGRKNLLIRFFFGFFVHKKVIQRKQSPVVFLFFGHRTLPLHSRIVAISIAQRATKKVHKKRAAAKKATLSHFRIVIAQKQHSNAFADG